MANVGGLSGVPELIKKLRSFRDKQLKQLEAGLVKAGLHLQRKSQEVVPVDTGALKNSAFTRILQRNPPRKLTVVVVGYVTRYAIYVHEDLTMRHKPGKIAKYLEVPARRELPVLKNIIDAELRR